MPPGQTKDFGGILGLYWICLGCSSKRSWNPVKSSKKRRVLKDDVCVIKGLWIDGAGQHFGLLCARNGGADVQFLFGDYALDIDRRELSRGSKRIEIEPQVFDLLVYLVQNRDGVVSKDDLVKAVWKGRIVSDSALSSRITAVRHAIGDDGEQQRLIRTVPRRGFRFVGAVTASDYGGPAKTAPPVAGPEPMPALTLALPDKPSIAVLPFRNIGGDAEQEYFADGIVEEITTAIARLAWLFVIARNSSFT